MNLPDPKAQVGGVPSHPTDDPLVVLLYLLLRDHIQAGVFEGLVTELTSGGSDLTNPFLAEYAENIAARLRLEQPTQVMSLLTPDEGAAIAGCISVAARMAGPYETYGGIEVRSAVRAATDALDRLGIEHETEVVG